MSAVFFQHKNLLAGILALLFCSIICQIIIGVIYRRLIWESEHMSTTTDKSLQQLKLKFSGCYKLNEKISNIPVFVDKYLGNIKCKGVSLTTLKHLSGQLMLLAVLAAGIGACLGIVRGDRFLAIAPFYIISFAGQYCYFAVASFVDIPGRLNILRINLIDYLENHLANRLEQTELDMQLIRPDGSASDNRPGPDTDPKSAPAFSVPEMKELELLLQEFLT